MVPSSFITSQMTPAGWRPASRARSTERLGLARCAEHAAASSRAAGRRGPAGRGRSARHADWTATWMVWARSAAEMPVVTPARASIDHGEGGARAALLRCVHQRQPELARSARRSRREADQAAAVHHHEVDGCSGVTISAAMHQVALVLAVGVVHHHHHPAGADVLDRVLDRRERRVAVAAPCTARSTVICRHLPAPIRWSSICRLRLGYPVGSPSRPSAPRTSRTGRLRG